MTGWVGQQPVGLARAYQGSVGVVWTDEGRVGVVWADREPVVAMDAGLS